MDKPIKIKHGRCMQSATDMKMENRRQLNLDNIMIWNTICEDKKTPGTWRSEWWQSIFSQHLDFETGHYGKSQGMLSQLHTSCQLTVSLFSSFPLAPVLWSTALLYPCCQIEYALPFKGLWWCCPAKIPTKLFQLYHNCGFPTTVNPVNSEYGVISKTVKYFHKHGRMILSIA